MRSGFASHRAWGVEYGFIDWKQFRIVEQLVRSFELLELEFILVNRFIKLLEFFEFLEFVELFGLLKFLELVEHRLLFELRGRRIQFEFRRFVLRFRFVRRLRTEHEALVGGELAQERLLLRNFQSPGDILMLTAAVRDLHACYPGRFVTDVRTSCPDLWQHNPHLTPLRDDDPGVRVVDCQYPLIHRSNTAPYHFIHGFIEHLNDTLGLEVRPTLFRGDIHLSRDEERWFEEVISKKGRPPRFWMFASGGKFDYTIKWWDAKRYQKVVDHFSGRLDFVQIGEGQHHQPALRRVLDLRGQTTLRQLVRLMHHAEGAISAVSLLMHLAAAVPVKAGMPLNRACVVIAGGREPPHFTFYPHHQYLHTVGALLCCDNGGCWKSRTKPLGDGDAKDSELCLDVVGDLPRCMDMITAADVIRAIERYYEGGALPPLRRARRVGAAPSQRR